MKKFTESIKQRLENEELLNTLENHYEQRPQSQEQDVSFEEAYDRFQLIRSTLLDHIDSGVFDELISLNRRKHISNQLQNLHQQRGNVNQSINYIETLYDSLLIAGLIDRAEEKGAFKEKLKQLTQVRRRYNSFITDFEKAHKELDFIDEQKKELANLKKEVSSTKNRLMEDFQEIHSLTAGAKAEVKNISKAREHIRQEEEQVEAQKNRINAFYENVEEFKSSISDLEQKAKEIVAKEADINKIVDESKSALQLSSTVGISAAFATQYDKSNNSKVYRGWIWGAAIFIGIALLLTIWIVGGWGITDKDSISSIVGRVVAVVVAISGATFCAKRYVSQKNLAEDYAYKATLSKSILAFKGEIEKGQDPNQVADYLSTVLSEIHKDPLRRRTDSEDDDLVLSERKISLMEKVKGLFS